MTSIWQSGMRQSIEEGDRKGGSLERAIDRSLRDFCDSGAGGENDRADYKHQ